MLRNLLVRAAVVGGVLMFALAMAGSTPVLAQNDDCICDSITINIDPHVLCRVTVCVLPQYGARICVTIGPGRSAKLPCIPGARLVFLDCHGNSVPFDPVNGCHIGIGVGPNCCTIDACLNPDTSCPVIDVRPSIIDSCPCL